MFIRRRFRKRVNRRRPARRALANRPRVRRARVSRPLRNAIKAVAKSQIETKYVAEEILTEVLVPSGTTTPGGLLRMMPKLGVGTGDAQRVGERIEPVKATTKWTIHWHSTPQGSTGDFQDLTINLIVLAVKGAGNAAAVAATPATSLLRTGAGINCDPNQAVFTQIEFLEQVNHYPVNTEQYSVLKHFKHRFAKGSYDINGPPGTNATSQICFTPPAHTFQYSWKPPALKYSVDPAGVPVVLPTNHYPVYVLWCTTNDGGPYQGLLEYGVRTDLWFKDA